MENLESNELVHTKNDIPKPPKKIFLPRLFLGFNYKCNAWNYNTVITHAKNPFLMKLQSITL